MAPEPQRMRRRDGLAQYAFAIAPCALSWIFEKLICKGLQKTANLATVIPQQPSSRGARR